MASIPAKPPQETSRGRVWYFAECAFHEVRYELRVRGNIVELEAKPLELLHQLLLRAGDVVRKEDLLETVWPGVLVVDASLDGNHCSYPTMDRDPLFDKMRNTPAFAKVRAAGIACHEDFVANRQRLARNDDSASGVPGLDAEGRH